MSRFVYVKKPRPKRVSKFGRSLKFTGTLLIFFLLLAVVPSHAGNNGPEPMAGLSNSSPAAEGSSVTFTFSNGNSYKYSLDWDNDGTYELIDQSSPTATHTWFDEGIFTVRGRVKDSTGGTVIYTTFVNVFNVAPIATFSNNGPVSEGTPATVEFTNQYDPGKLDTKTYSYDWNSDGIFDIINSPLSSASHTWYDDGIYMVMGMIKDNDGDFTVYSTLVYVYNAAPAVTITSMLQPSPEFILSNDLLTFNGRGIDLGSDDLIFIWSWGDGTAELVTYYLNNPPNQPVEVFEEVEHAYTSPGVYTLTLTVTDDNGGIGSDTLLVEVVRPQEATEIIQEIVVEFDISGGAGNNFESILDTSIKSMDKKKDNTASNQLNAFINVVTAQTGKRLSDEEAQRLIDAAESIIDFLEDYPLNEG